MMGIGVSVALYGVSFPVDFDTSSPEQHQRVVLLRAMELVFQTIRQSDVIRVQSRDPIPGCLLQSEVQGIGKAGVGLRIYLYPPVPFAELFHQSAGAVHSAGA